MLAHSSGHRGSGSAGPLVAPPGGKRPPDRLGGYHSLMDALLLSRVQFAANISFHILFPAITIALGWLLLFFRWRWLASRDGAWLLAWRFWTKVFALSFALGVVSGVT